MAKIEDHVIITHKQIETIFEVKRNKASTMGKKTRLFYNFKPKSHITFGQVMRANNLEK